MTLIRILVKWRKILARMLYINGNLYESVFVIDVRRSSIQALGLYNFSRAFSGLVNGGADIREERDKESKRGGGVYPGGGAYNPIRALVYR